jgi:hypothetical protein
MQESNAKPVAEMTEMRQLITQGDVSSRDTTPFSQTLAEAWGPGASSLRGTRAMNAAESTTAAGADADGKKVVNAIEGAVNAEKVVGEKKNGELLVGKEVVKVGIDHAQKAGKLTDDTPNGRLEREINDAVNNAVRNVMNNPRWDVQFAGAIRAAERELDAHPKIGSEMKAALIEMKQADQVIDALNKKIKDGVSALPAWEQKLIQRLEEQKGGQEKLYEYLKQNHPDLYKQHLNRDKSVADYNNAAKQYSDLERISEGPTNSRLDYANFLARRGNKEDMPQLTALLTDLVQRNPRLVETIKPDHRFHDLRDLAITSGADKDPTFRKALENAGIKPDEYFSPRHNRPMLKKHIENVVPMVPERPVNPEK